jgi:hypothetical protein
MKTSDIAVECDRRNERESWLDAVRCQVESLRFGVVQIVVHDSRVVQIEKTEKIRLEQSEAA